MISESRAGGRTEKSETLCSDSDGECGLSRIRRWGQDVVLFCAVASALVSPLAELARFSRVTEAMAAGTLLIAGGLRLRHAEAQRQRRSYRRYRWVRAHARLHRNLALWWIGGGALLLVLALTVASSLPVAILGVLATLAICARARKLSVGWMAGGLAVTLTMAVCAGSAFGLVIAAEVAHDLAPHAGRSAAARPVVRSSPPAGPSASIPPPRPAPPTYAELCPELPDPTAIGHGLGELFRRDGAVKDGCGGPARNPVALPSVWFSVGTCGGELRSLAIASPGRNPAMLYGEAARFAREAAEDGGLLFAEVAQPGGGEVAAVGTVGGTYLFARSSPSIRPGLAGAHRCTEVGGVARPFARLAPPLAEMWLWHVKLQGWAWPIGETTSASTETAFLDYETGAVVARGDCERDDVCELDGRGEHWRYEGRPAVTVADLAPYMPARLE